ncbi:MAG: LysE family translocator, partial [Anaerolineae bacterium]|nr:LysE family translocator [Anaerolineae bacterium]
VWVHLLGGAFIVWLGIQAAVTPPAENQAKAQNGASLGKAYLSTFLLTLSNPMTIMSFLAIFAGAGFSPAAGGDFSAGLMVLGVFCGSGFWWLLLSQGVYWLRKRINANLLTWVNRAAGAGLVIFGLLTLGGELVKLV